MDERIRFSDAALDDLEGVRARFTQPGAGQRAAKRLAHVLDAIDDLPDHIDQWPKDKDPVYRKRIVEGCHVRYREDREDLETTVFIARIFPPGADK